MIFKTSIIIISFLLLILYICPLFETKLNIGNIFGITLGLEFVMTGFLWDMIKNNIIFKVIAIINIIIIILFITILIYIIHNSKNNTTNQKTVIVLGCRVKKDKPSLSLINRCKVASNYLNKNKDAVVILSGGQGEDEMISEAEAMKTLMLKYGIKEHRIYLEDESKSTDENIKFSKAIIERYSLSNDIAIATSEYHEARAKIIAKKYGFNAKSLPAKTINRIKAPVYTREVIGLIYQWLKSKK